MSDFFAFLSRMKYIKRWSLMHSTVEENILEHTAEVVMISHSLATIKNTLYGGNLNIEKIMLLALYHESGEVITGDLPTPIKYFNDDIRKAYGNLEDNACKKLISMLPKELQPSYSEYILHDVSTPEYKIVKAADRIAALIKCIEEIKSGNLEFKKAKVSIEKDIKKINEQAVSYFMENFVPAYSKTLDELNNS